MTEKDLQVLYGELIAKCWEDDAFKAKFIANPGDVMEEFGVPIEEGVEYKVIEAPKMVKYIVLPHEKVAESVQAISKMMLAAVESEQQSVVPEGVEFRIVQNTEDTRYIVLHPSPDTLTAAELDLVAGGDKNSVSNVNYGVNVNIGTNVELAVNVTTVATTAEAAAVVVVVGAIVFI